MRLECIWLPLCREDKYTGQDGDAGPCVPKRILLCDGGIADYGGKLLEDWYRLRQTHANCRLTDGGDRVPAISALARYIRQKLDPVYYGGVWESDVGSGLAWFSLNGEKLSWRAARQAAPSWS